MSVMTMTTTAGAWTGILTEEHPIVGAIMGGMIGTSVGLLSPVLLPCAIVSLPAFAYRWYLKR